MDNLHIEGTVRIYEGNKKEKLLAEYKNLFLNPGRKALYDTLMGTTISPLKYSFLAIGIGTASPALADVKLGSESFRKPVSEIIGYGDKIVVDTFVESSEANFNWTEIGLYSGGEWSLKDSGTLMNRALINEAKNSMKSVTVSWEIKII